MDMKKYLKSDQVSEVIVRHRRVSEYKYHFPENKKRFLGVSIPERWCTDNSLIYSLSEFRTITIGELESTSKGLYSIEGTVLYSNPSITIIMSSGERYTKVFETEREMSIFISEAKLASNTINFS